MRNKNFISFNLFTFFIFMIISLNIIGPLLDSILITTRAITLLLILLFCLMGILIQFSFVIKKLSENNKKA